jgi:hypothetical protein
LVLAQIGLHAQYFHVRIDRKLPPMNANRRLATVADQLPFTAQARECLANCLLLVPFVVPGCKRNTIAAIRELIL